MIRQEYTGIKREGVFFHYFPEYLAQELDIFRFTENFFTVKGDHRKKICSAVFSCPSVLHNRFKLLCWVSLRSTQPALYRVFIG
jgi:hypothetical protein